MAVHTPESVGRQHHEWTWRYFCLLMQIYLLRMLAYIEVALTDNLRPKVKDDVKVTMIQVPSRDPGRTIKAALYEPVDMPQGPRPVNVNAHGSGFCIPAFFGNSRFFLYLTARKLRCYAIDVCYRKSPEYPYPFPTQDVEDVVNWVFTQPDKFDLSRVSMTGFSAGGNLALSTTNRLGRDKITAVVSFYAPLDATTSGAPVGFRGNYTKEFRSGVELLPWAFSGFFSSFVPMQTDPGDPYLSVINSPLDRFPDYVLFVAGMSDVMYSDSKAMYEHMVESGTIGQKQHCRFLQVPNEAHAFDEQPKCRESEEWRDRAYLTSIDTIFKSWYPQAEPLPMELDAVAPLHL
ncbi:hydrolase [Malassezia pachydermatis]|uniref:Arylacetamide deacetylase n=1 Tax=Malassezia pachydermatis TaxID=77020 RepID=A0A0M9VRD2_9BASI|nr:arylacetamide deacetylase [Malassezia pachydermatis]KOS16485.1 arylacetamide deacetylase [Malassezia pachydermatis]